MKEHLFDFMKYNTEDQTEKTNEKFEFFLLKAEHAEKIGVDSLLCLPELYFKPSNVEELIDYLHRVGASAPKTPLLYYHYPMATTVNCKYFY